MLTTDYLTPNEVAQLLEVSKWTVHRWVRLGQLGSYRIGGRVRIPREAVEAFIRDGQHPEPLAAVS